ncbi:UNVERIFIED_CONTAM: hypothetical protein Slati_3700900 [Sesamum latifolium]|uniref:Hydroxyproline-rich glycoprotein family protein n=1 Tax=Sesamum latifolium TaxID=2727402 RepID=A0AAW2U3D3_9LAMI
MDKAARRSRAQQPARWRGRQPRARRVRAHQVAGPASSPGHRPRARRMRAHQLASSQVASSQLAAAASRLPSNPNPNYPQLAPRPPQPHPHPQDPSQLLYPVASSGRGFLSRPVAMPAARPSPRPPFVFPYLDQGQGNPGFVRANHFAHVFLGPGPGSAGNASSGGVMPGVVKGIPVPPSHPHKVGPPSASISDNNGHKDLRDKNKDDTFAIIRDRKVRISENASLYTLCRSWLRNGFPEEIQPQYLDAAKSLPRPLPAAAQVVDSPDKKSGDKEEEDEDESSVENLCEKELLQRHIKRAKRVRSRLREERLQRITRYKTRLALLLPPMVEQHFKNESAAPN